MRSGWLVCAALAAALLAPAKEKKAPPTSHDQNDSVRIDGTLYVDREQIKELIGNDLGGDYVVMSVTVTPRLDKAKVDYDDFTLLSARDGEKAHPFNGYQIAGRGALVVSSNGVGRSRGGVMMGDPTYGPLGMPMPGSGGEIASGVDQGDVRVKQSSGVAEKENPLVKQLNAKMLPAKESDKPLTGLLYFLMAPKQKAKDIELMYNTPNGKLYLRFK